MRFGSRGETLTVFSETIGCFNNPGLCSRARPPEADKGCDDEKAQLTIKYVSPPAAGKQSESAHNTAIGPWMEFRNSSFRMIDTS